MFVLCYVFHLIGAIDIGVLLSTHGNNFNLGIRGAGEETFGCL
jgi:hypothetical protein